MSNKYGKDGYNHKREQLDRINKKVFTQLYEGDGLEILPESKKFNLKCCSCGFIHHIKIEHTNKGNPILRFY